MSTAGIAGTMIAMQSEQTRMGIQTAMVKQQVKADQGVIELLASAAQASPAPGTGLTVDKTA
jgi:hypothetical protein